MFDKVMLVALVKTLPLSQREEILESAYKANYDSTVALYASQISDRAPEHARLEEAKRRYEMEYKQAKAAFLD